MIHDDDQGYVVPKRMVTVELALLGRPPQRAQVFVPTDENGQLARHAVVNLLEKELPFLPTRVESDRTPQIFNKAALVWVAIARAEADAAAGGGDDDELFEVRHEVRLELQGGDMLVGELLYSASPEHRRVADYLNAPGRFFRLWTPERLFLVNKSFVERVIEAPLDLEE